MKKILKLMNKLFIKIAPIIPEIVYKYLSKCVPKEAAEKALENRVRDFAFKLLDNPDKYYKRIISKKTVMEIYEGNYPYGYFNVCYLNNVMDLILYSLYQGCIPFIKINHDQIDKNKWDWYFKQPIEVILGETSVPEDYCVVRCDVKDSPLKCTYADGFYPYSANFPIWKYLYDKFVVFNEDTEKYITQEKKQLIKGKTLGVLIRGTDFTTLRPRWHPVQPETLEIIEKVEEYIEKKNYEYIYVATEEKRLFDMVVERFGKQHVLSNDRTYYDSVYYGENHNYIGEIEFKRENDNFLKGIEYLSSITILSSCNGLVAGNCGGNMYALLKSKKYEDIYVFNKGYY